MGSHRHHRIHRHHRLLLALALARVVFTCTFRTTKTCQQEALGIHRPLLLEQELWQRHLLGGFSYMFRTHSWSKLQAREEDRRHRRHRLRQLPFEHSTPSLSIETSR